MIICTGLRLTMECRNLFMQHDGEAIPLSKHSTSELTRLGECLNIDLQSAATAGKLTSSKASLRILKSKLSKSPRP